MNPNKKNKPIQRRKPSVAKNRNKIIVVPPKINKIQTELNNVYNWGLLDLNIPEIHKKEKGLKIKIGVIDSGVPDHKDLVNRIKNYTNVSSSNTHLDKIGHSTFVCGLIAAEYNQKGIVGVAPESSLYIAKALDDNGRGTPAQLKKAVDWCIEQSVDIISVSAGFTADYPPLHDSIKKAFHANVITIAACGNAGKQMDNVYFPARYPEVIGVAAYTKERTVADFSSRGVNVAFAMPGKDLYSTFLNNTFINSSGSSFACPILAGICALILSSHRKREASGISSSPCQNSTQMMEHLIKYSIKLGAKEETGFGTIDIESIMNAGI